MRSRIHGKAAYACARILCVALALFAWLPGPVAARAAELDGTLRVRLARLGAPSEITLAADCDYALTGDPSVRIPSGTAMTLSAGNGRLTLTVSGQSVRLGGSVLLMRQGTGHTGLTFLSPALSNRFCGDLALAASGDAISAALSIDVEDYLYGVVGCEMPPTGGLEALKAQAVVARTYALRQKSAKGGASGILTDVGDDLSFRGYNSDYDDVTRAVDETRGQVLCYGDALAACCFCESNGGQTESSANALGEALPYSVVMDDPYDLEGGGTSKTATLNRDASDLNPALREALAEAATPLLRAQGFGGDASDINILSIEDIQPEAPRYSEPSRLYRALAFTLNVATGQGDTTEVTVRVPTYGGIEDWYDLGINDEDNETVWVGHSGREFTVTFRRSGHGMGMSQRGALAMAKKGLDCETILEYYYPGTQLREMELKAGASDPSAFPAAGQPIATGRLSQKTRLYERADSTAAALTTLPAGVTVSIYAVQGEWAAVGSGDLYGFIRAETLTSFALVGVTATQVQDETFAQIRRGPVDILQLPVDTALALERLADGATVRLDAYTDAWALVSAASGVEGFIPRDALTLQTDSDAASGEIVDAQDNLYGLLTEAAGLYVNADDAIEPRQTLPEGTYVRVLAYSSAWAYVRTSDGESGYVKLGALSAVRQAAPESDGGAAESDITVVSGEEYRYVSADTLPLYESYSTDAAVLATLERGDRVQLGAYNDRWACVRVDGTTGFVPLSGLADAQPDSWQDAPEGGEITFVEGERYAEVTVDDAPLYPSYSDEDAPLALLGLGERVLLGAYNDQWACVRADGMTGFMRLETLSPVDSNP